MLKKLKKLIEKVGRSCFITRFAEVGAAEAGARMEECLGPVGQLVGMVVRTAVTFADTVNWMQDNMLAAQKEESMWYTGLDFERFKNELLIEARNAGCMSGRECYDHIRRKFQDEATLNNTRMNVVQTQSNAVDPKPKRRRRGHKRSVSFDFDQARTVAARTTAYNASAPTADPQEQGGVQQEQEHALVCRAVRMGVGAMNGKTMSDELLTILQDSGDPKAEEIF
eukprot:gene16155-24717_t